MYFHEWVLSVFCNNVIIIHMQDNCVPVANANQDDEDGDGVGDACDNCIYAYNPGQENHDGDHTGDECDEDDDNDGVGK